MEENKYKYNKYTYNYPIDLKLDYKKFVNNFSDSIINNVSNVALDDVRDMVKSFVKYDAMKKEAAIVPIIMPKSIVYSSESDMVFRNAIFKFNKTIQREGISVNWETEGKGVIWSLIMHLNTLAVSITMENPYYTPLPKIQMNGSKKIKKSDNTLVNLNIERLYVVDSRGMEITLHSII